MAASHGWQWFTAVLIAGLSPYSLRAETSRPLWPFAHPNAKSLIGIDVRRIRQSGLARSVDMNWLEGIAGHLPGLDLLSQVDRVLISSPGSVNADDAGEPPILIAIRGRFDLAGVRQILREHGAKAQMFDSVTIFRPQGKGAKEFAFAPLDDETILAGDAQSIFSSIERRRLPAAEQASSIAVRAGSLSADCDIWAVMNEPGALAGGHFPLVALAQSGLMAGVSGLELGISLKEGVMMNGTLLLRSGNDARALKGELAKLLKLTGKDQATPPELALVAKKLKLDVEPSGLRFSLRMARTEFEGSLRNVQARHKAKESVIAASPPMPPPKPQVIRIEGLDGGAREVRYGSPPR